MRLSGNEKDPDYWRNHFECCPDIFLNGILMHHVVEADNTKGFVVTEVWRDGKPTLEATGSCIARQLLSGDVKIYDRSPAAATGGAA